MNVQTMQMDPRIAKIHYGDYHRKVLEHREERKKQIALRGREIGKEIKKIRIEKSRLEREDEELMRAYQAMADGNRILNLPHVLKAAGIQPKTHLPALAIARADWKSCFFQVDYGQCWYSSDSNIPWNVRMRKGKGFIPFAQSVFPSETTNTHWRTNTANLPRYPAKAMVPAIPAHLRPSNVDEMYILWDAVWETRPPIDPLLLKRVSDTIYVVLASWDLTPLEQAILEGRVGS